MLHGVGNRSREKRSKNKAVTLDRCTGKQQNIRYKKGVKNIEQRSKAKEDMGVRGGES